MPRALVMGGSSGIRRATVQRLVNAGYEVHVNGRDRAKVEGVLAAVGDGARPAVADAADAQACAALAQELAPLDVLVLSLSGGGGGGPFATLDLDELHAAFEAKLWAHLTVLQTLLPSLADDASITFISAGSARAALPGTAGLAAINGAIEALVGPLAAELAPRRVNAISPGVIRTPWWDGLPPDERDALFARFADTLPVGHIGEAEHVAGLVVEAATNPFVTGSVFECDGGGHLAMGARL